MNRRSGIAAAVALCAGMAGCADERMTAGTGSLLQPPGSSFRATVAAFDCALTYDVVTQTNEAELAPYEVEAVTDTARICETWTGSDYNVEVVQLGSSEPPSDYAEDIKTVVYQNGTTTAYDVYGNFAESQPDVGATSFDFVAADDSERQASYNDPYYGVMASEDPNCTEGCLLMSVSGESSAPAANPGIRRGALKGLLKGKTEIAPSAEGFRRFEQVSARGDRSIISIDPVTELIRRRELWSGGGSLRAELTWARVQNKYVRDRMEMISDELVGTKRYTSRTLVLIRNLHWNPAFVK
jgi:hypothetical protein